MSYLFCCLTEKFVIRDCGFSKFSDFRIIFFHSAWLVFWLCSYDFPRFAHEGKMISFMALMAFLTKCRAIFSFLMDSSQSTKFTFRLLARSLSSIESITMLLLGFLLFSIKHEKYPQHCSVHSPCLLFVL